MMHKMTLAPMVFSLALQFVGCSPPSAFEKTKSEAESGDAEAQYNLGLMYDKGNGVEQGYSEAVLWFRKAAEQGNEAAIRSLKVMGK